MGWPLIFIGLILVIVGVNNKIDLFNATLRDDILGDGQNNFLFWIVAIFIIAALGAVKELRPVSNAFLVLVITVLLLSNRGFFVEFQRQLER